ncbi:MAG: SpoIIE family protein phosphatase [Lentisphaeria bacterium]|nr:SpoIIE family protein phosphatase [Lentisphaeria bacterium]
MLLLLSAFIIFILGYALWLAVLYGFTMKDLVWRAKKDRSGMITFLNKFTTSFSTHSDIKLTKEMIAFYTSDVLESKSLCIYRVIEEHGSLFLQPTSSSGAYPHHHNNEGTAFRIPVDHNTLLGRVVLERSSILISQYANGDSLVKEALPDGDVDTLMITPLELESGVSGLIVVVDSIKLDYHYTKQDLELLQSLAKQVAFAHEFMDIYTKLKNQQRISKELELAEHIQNSLLPEQAPEWGDFRILPFSSPAKEVGGDYYDFIEIDDDRLLVIVADASGKGIPAGMIMTMCRSSLHALVENFTDLNTLLVTLNSILFKDTEGCHFITLAACLLNRKTNEMEYARAGHTEFLLRVKENDILVSIPEGSALGLLPPMFVNSFEVLKVQVEKNQQILLFSDGITEACDRKEIEYGVDRLIESWDQLLIENGDQFTPSQIVEKVDCFTEYAAASDDRTIVFIERV